MLYKKQKLGNGRPSKSNVPPTIYETPKESLINFPSSIMNGITKEGGLVSLTFKSITCAKFVENLDWMREALVKDEKEFEPTRISERDFDAKSMIDKLKKENAALKDKPEPMAEDDRLSQLHLDIEHRLRSGGDIGEIKRDLVENCGKNGGLGIVGRKITYRCIQIPEVQVDVIENVKNADLSVYDKKKISTKQRNPPSADETATLAQESSKVLDQADTEANNEAPFSDQI